MAKGEIADGYSLREFSERDTNLPARREVWSAAWIAVGVIGVPVLLTMVSLLFFYALGMPWTKFSAAAFCLIAFASNFILLPLAAGLTVRNREHKQEIAGEMMTFFSHKVTTLYALAEENPGLSADTQVAEVFEAYTRADREIQENVHDPLVVRETIEQGVFLADEVLAAHKLRKE